MTALIQEFLILKYKCLRIIMADDALVDVEEGVPPIPEMKGAMKPIQETTPLERLMMVVAAGAVGTSLGAIILVGGYVVIIAGVLSCAMGPFAYYQQTQLTDVKTLQETHEAVQKEVNRLKVSNERLSKNIAELSDTVDRLEEVENALDVITSQQGQSVSAFAEQVEKSREICANMKRNQKGAIVQNLLSVVFASDTDGDQIIDPEEVEDLIQRLQQIGGIDVRDEKFREEFSGGSFSSLMNVVSNLLRDDIPDEDRIFVLDEAPVEGN